MRLQAGETHPRHSDPHRVRPALRKVLTFPQRPGPTPADSGRIDNVAAKQTKPVVVVPVARCVVVTVGRTAVERRIVVTATAQHTRNTVGEPHGSTSRIDKLPQTNQIGKR